MGLAAGNYTAAYTLGICCNAAWQKWAQGSRMNSIERYRRYAADCIKMARSAANDGDKALLLQMAETWRHLAELAQAQAAARGDEDY